MYLEHTGSSWLDFMSRTILFPICILSFLFSSFGFDFSAALLRNRKPSKQQQHITNHVPFGEWYRTKWLYTRSLTTYIHTSRSTIYGAKFILSKWLKFRMKRTMEISFRKASWFHRSNMKKKKYNETEPKWARLTGIWCWCFEIRWWGEGLRRMLSAINYMMQFSIQFFRKFPYSIEFSTRMQSVFTLVHFFSFGTVCMQASKVFHDKRENRRKYGALLRRWFLA